MRDRERVHEMGRVGDQEKCMRERERVCYDILIYSDLALSSQRLYGCTK